MSHLRLAIELTVIIVLGILLVLFFLWCGVSVRREFKNRGVLITNEELNRERTTVMIPLSIRDLQ